MKIEGVTKAGTIISLSILKPADSMNCTLRCAVIIPTRNIMEWYNTLAGYEYMYNPYTNCVDVILDTKVVVGYLKIAQQVKMSFEVNEHGVVEGLGEKDTFFRLVNILNNSLFREKNRKSPDLICDKRELSKAVNSVLASSGDKFQVGQMYSLLQARSRVLSGIEREG